jgi:hypothetical protein
MTVHPIGRPATRLALGPAVWVALLLSAVLAGGLLWVAGEMHYRSCVRAAGAAYQGTADNLTRLVRNDQLSKCSRTPF